MNYKLQKAEEHAEEETSLSERCLAKSRTANAFALEVVKQLYNLDKLEAVSPYFVLGQLTAVEKKGAFRLIGMFVRCSQEELEYRNSRSTSARWFATPFVVKGKRCS